MAISSCAKEGVGWGRSRGLLIGLAFLSLGTGGLIYLLYRAPGLRLFGWLEALGLSSAIGRGRSWIGGDAPPEFVLYNLPDLLWIVAYLLFVRAIIPMTPRWIYLFWMLLMQLLGVAHEIFQGLGWMAGSFDVVDLLCYVIPTSFALSINIINHKLTILN